MKLNGNDIVRATRDVVIARPDKSELRFKVASITVGVKRDFDKIWPRPKVPLIVTQSKTGREEREDWRDDKFVSEMEERQSLQNIYLMYRVLEHDVNVTFDNIPTDKDSLRKLATEVASSGLSEGDVVVILKEALIASNLTADDIDKAKASF